MFKPSRPSPPPPSKNPLINWLQQNQHPLVQSRELAMFLDAFHTSILQHLEEIASQQSDPSMLFTPAYDIQTSSQDSFELHIMWNTTISFQELSIGRTIITFGLNEPNVSSILVLNLELMFEPNQLGKFQVFLFNMRQILQKACQTIINKIIQQQQQQSFAPNNSGRMNQQAMNQQRSPQPMMGMMGSQQQNNMNPQYQQTSFMPDECLPEEEELGMPNVSDTPILSQVKRNQTAQQTVQQSAQQSAQQTKPVSKPVSIPQPIVNRQQTEQLETGDVDPSAKLKKISSVVQPELDDVPDVPVLSLQNLIGSKVGGNKQAPAPKSPQKK